MMSAGIFRSRIFAIGVAGALLLLLTPVAEFGQEAPSDEPAAAFDGMPAGGVLTGKVLGEDGRPAANVTVQIRNLNSQREYSVNTNAKGEYRLQGIDEGWYTMGVTTARGDFNLNYGVYVKAGETAKLTVSLKAGGILEGKGGNGGGGKGFFQKPIGILTIVALGGAAGFGVYELTKTKEETSPIR